MGNVYSISPTYTELTSPNEVDAYALTISMCSSYGNLSHPFLLDGQSRFGTSNQHWDRLGLTEENMRESMVRSFYVSPSLTNQVLQ